MALYRGLALNGTVTSTRSEARISNYVLINFWRFERFVLGGEVRRTSGLLLLNAIMVSASGDDISGLSGAITLDRGLNAQVLSRAELGTYACS